MKHISIDAFKEVLEAEKNNSSIDFINVCEPAEYKQKHIDGVRNVPLGTLEDHADELDTKQTIYVHCQSGNRGKQAVEKLSELGVKSELVNVEGGMMAWNQAGYPTMSLSKMIPIMQQVLLAAGLLILIGFVGGKVINQYFEWIVLLVGLGLVLSGSTGWCGMAKLLSKMPWNK